MSNPRPFVQVREHIWRDAEGNETPGIALKHGLSVKAHLTPAEAFELANTITDMAESIEAEQEKS